MTLEDLARLGRRMRRAQAAYFARRNSSLLDAARALEREFDAACGAILEPRGLFDARDPGTVSQARHPSRPEHDPERSNDEQT